MSSATSRLRRALSHPFGAPLPLAGEGVGERAPQASPR